MRTLGCIAAAWLLAAASGAQAQGVPNPDWLQKPTGEDIARVYPEIAQVMNIEGRAMIACKIDADGHLQPCESVTALPAGLGFERAALSLAAKFQAAPTTQDGQATTGGEVRIPIRFNLPKWPAEPPEPLALIEGEIPEAAREIVRRTGAAKRMRPDPEPALLEIGRAGGGGADPVVLADGMAAVRKADAEAEMQWQDAIARALATRLGPAEMDQWLSALNRGLPPEDAAGQIATGRDPVFKAMMADAGIRLGKVYVARIRDIFCEARDCAPAPAP